MGEYDPLRDLPYADPIIVEAFHESGMVSAGGMGLAPLTWVELKAYCDTRRNDLTGWEANAVMMMSRAYVSQSRDAEVITCIPPYQRELTPEEWQERSEMIRKQLDNVGKK